MFLLKNVNNLSGAVLTGAVMSGPFCLGPFWRVTAECISATTQNTIIEICGSLLREDIVREANNSVAFSILADETNDISGIEQMSLGVRFVKEQNGKMMVTEEFMGYIPIVNRTAEGLTNTIITNSLEFWLNMTKLVGQGYYGCSTMAGKEGGFQAIIRNKCPKEAFVTCSSHELNLVVNDTNNVNSPLNTHMAVTLEGL